MSSINTLPLNTGQDIDSFLDTAGQNVFTPIVTVAKPDGLPAKSLQTGEKMTFPYGTDLILGRKIESTTLYQVARSDEKDFTAAVKLNHLDRGSVRLAALSHWYYTSGKGETRTQGFFGLDQLYVKHLFSIRGISGGDVYIRPGTTVCHGHSPTPGVQTSSILRVTDEGAIHYVVLPPDGAQQMMAQDVLSYANGNMHRAVPGYSDYTCDNEEFPAGQRQFTARQDFDACGDACQIVHISQGDLYELRCKQDGGVDHYCKVATGELFVSDAPK